MNKPMSAASSRAAAERQRSELSSSRQRELDAFPGREHRAHVADRLRTHVQVHREPRRRQDEGDREERALAPQHRQKHVLVSDLAKPEPVRIEANERGSCQEEQDADQEKM